METHTPISTETETVTDEEGRQTVVRAKCEHDAAFWTMPDVEQRLYQSSFDFLKANGRSDEEAQKVSQSYAHQAVEQFKKDGSVFFYFPQDPAAATNPTDGAANPTAGEGASDANAAGAASTETPAQPPADAGAGASD